MDIPVQSVKSPSKDGDLFLLDHVKKVLGALRAPFLRSR